MVMTSAPDPRGDDGFTLIELLVVMIIIGILAGIAVPVFLGQRAKAHDTAVKADLSAVGKELAGYWVDNTSVPVFGITSGRYTLSYGTPASGHDIGAASSGVTNAGVTTNIVDSTHWCVALTNPDGDAKTYKYSARAGLAAGNCVAADVA
jgi:type IV pilus assembly protein PilA